MGALMNKVRNVRKAARIDLRVQDGRGTEDASTMKQAFEDQWDVVQDSLN